MSSVLLNAVEHLRLKKKEKHIILQIKKQIKKKEKNNIEYIEKQQNILRFINQSQMQLLKELVNIVEKTLTLTIKNKCIVVENVTIWMFLVVIQN